MSKNSFFVTQLAVVSLGAMLLTSCGIPGALGRSYRRIADFGTSADEAGKAREMMADHLRNMQREVEAGPREATAGEADSTP